MCWRVGCFSGCCLLWWFICAVCLIVFDTSEFRLLVVTCTLVCGVCVCLAFCLVYCIVLLFGMWLLVVAPCFGWLLLVVVLVGLRW